MRHTVAYAAIVISTLSAPAQSGQDEAQKVGEAVLLAWNSAAIGKDVVALRSLYSEDAVQINPEAILKGRPAIQQAWAEVTKVLTFEPSNMEDVRMVGADVILRAGSWKGTLTTQNGQIPLHGHWSDVVVRNGSEWKILRETHNVSQ